MRDTDLTYLLYEEGGYFHAHEDYLSFTTNLVEEYTGLLVLEASPDLQGGETVLSVNAAIAGAAG